MFKLKGEIKAINEEVQVTVKFKKKEFVLIDDSSQYPQFINFQLTQDRCALIDSYSVGQRISVDFNIRGREWTDKTGNLKYFNSFDVWRLEAEGQNTMNDIPPIPDAFDGGDEEVLPF